jgi:hypothetical protein
LPGRTPHDYAQFTVQSNVGATSKLLGECV